MTQAGRAGIGLDALNLLVAGSQTGFGAFVAIYLTSQGWTQAHIGEALSLGTVVAVASQVPAGALVDRARDKRLVVGVGAGAVAASALLFLWPTPASIIAAEVLHGFASCLVGPGIAALSLALVSENGFGERLGGNARFRQSAAWGLRSCWAGLAPTCPERPCSWLRLPLCWAGWRCCACSRAADRPTFLRAGRRPRPLAACLAVSGTSSRIAGCFGWLGALGCSIWATRQCCPWWRAN